MAKEVKLACFSFLDGETQEQYCSKLQKIWGSNFTGQCGCSNVNNSQSISSSKYVSSTAHFVLGRLRLLPLNQEL
jgi:hypothetical protein